MPSTNLDELVPLVNMINRCATGDVLFNVLYWCIIWLWSHFHSCFFYGGRSLIVVYDINTERDSGTSVSKQQEPSLYSSCPGVRLVFCVRECLRALMRVEIIVFPCLVIIWGFVCKGTMNSGIPVSDVWPSHFCQKRANNSVFFIYLQGSSILIIYFSILPFNFLFLNPVKPDIKLKSKKCICFFVEYFIWYIRFYGL